MHAQSAPAPAASPAATPATPPPSAPTAAELAPITFSKLLFRVEQEDEIGVAKHDYRVFILEEMRARGFNAVGAENLVFEKDDSDRADYVVGGTVREVKCREVRKVAVACFIGVDWELLDTQRDEVVYKAYTRHAELGVHLEKNPATLGKRFVLGSLNRLLARPKLTELLRAAAASRLPRKPDYPEAVLRGCTQGALAMPADADKAISATVVIESRGVGSGFVVSPDGLVLTAAHVVSSAHPVVTMRDGSRYTADVLRVSRDHDVALLRIAANQAAPCLAPVLTASKPGEEIYAIGAPAGKQLGFSLTRGIVSGLRDFDGVQFVQTDASVSPGNSGGPLINASGGAVGVVSWKVLGSAVEGVAFAAPTATALAALSLKLGDHSDPWLLSAPAEAPDLQKHEPIVDAADPAPSLDPEGDRERAALAAKLERERAEDAREAELDRIEDARDDERDRRLSALTPGYVKVMHWTGLVLGVGGAVGAIGSAVEYETSNDFTRRHYQNMRLINDLSWVAAGLGTGLFITAWILQPSLPEEKAPHTQPARATLDLELGPGTLQLKGRY